MIAVHKYIIDLSATGIRMPDQAKVLTVAFQGDNLCLWAKVDTDNDLIVRHFHVYGTGHRMRGTIMVKHDFIGTGFMHNGLVFHVFEQQSLK